MNLRCGALIGYAAVPTTVGQKAAGSGASQTAVYQSQSVFNTRVDAHLLPFASAPTQSAHTRTFASMATQPQLIREASGRLSTVEEFTAGGDARSDSCGATALHAAARGGQSAIVSALLSAGAEKDALDNDGLTPLIWAADKGHLEVVDTLLGAGVDCSARSSAGGATALHQATLSGSDSIVSALLCAGADKDALDNHGESPLMWAADGGHLTVVETLLRVGADFRVCSSDDGATALHRAASNGHAAVVSALLSAGAEKNAFANNSESPLMWAAVEGHLVVVETLLMAGANLGITRTGGGTALHIAALSGCVAIVSALLARGAGKDALDVNGESPLMWAAEKGHLAVVETLLGAGADFNISRTPDGGAALHIAARAGHTAVVSALLNAGSGKCSLDNHGKSPLMWAVAEGHLAVVETLLESGADLSVRSRHDGSTPLLVAAHYTSWGPILAILKHGAAVNARNNYGKTPLHIVCNRKKVGTEAAVGLLLRWGADETKLDNRRRTPADMLDSASGDDEDEDQEQGRCLPQEIERVRTLLARAPIDRAWRRRCWLVMIRSRTSRARLAGCDDDVGGRGHTNDVAANEKKRRVPRTAEDIMRAREHDAQTNGGSGGTGASEVGDGGLSRMVEVLVGLELEGVFRTVLGFL